MTGQDEVELLVVGYDEVFMREAQENLRRASAGKEKDPTLHAGAAASAIISSVVAVEAFISERLSYHAATGKISEEDAERIRGKDREFKQLNALVKQFSPEGLDRHPAYEPLQALMSLRGCIVHRSAGYLRTKGWPDPIEGKHRRHIEHLDGEGLDWTSRVLNEVTAAWAVKTTEAILDEAGSHVPKPPKNALVKVKTYLVDGWLLGENPKGEVIGPEEF